ncbi:ion transporter [Verrucomicrobiaceae bacterium R5-34]|uniref:Ion transporter n=1 Tax=Oceaniferula flava TaxID=2800421 RepID=A0AAE2SBJ6_9BACT|nr:ion transporter [Oceaniferula flavus]MBK1830237.1 ion transporter [Verrucomicrobiaceae bacterium R5-34]MBK1854828.1 ion transporter [Oceaniferula flavus]MBM1136134.1 ion transporter [Oceaniferula flavus]
MFSAVHPPDDPHLAASDPEPSRSEFKERLWAIIFEAETPSGKFFDVALLWVIGISVLAVMLESVESIHRQYHQPLLVVEWICTVVFTVEYILRIWLVRRPRRYIFSFYGIVDLLSCLPSYLALIFTGGSHFIVIRLLRLLRMFRVLKMVGHVRGANTILRGLAASRAKITVFFFSMLIFAMLAGTLIYIVESGEPGTAFTSIPVSIYYAIVSITTVGYGDLAAQTVLGRLITALMVLAGYAIIAVPTGIVASDMVREALHPDESTDACPGCGAHGHLNDAVYCRKCGELLDD